MNDTRHTADLDIKTDSTYCLETRGLGKQYKNFKALSGLNLHVPRGAIYGLVGQNGAGKTTLFRLLCGLQTPTTGTYTLYGIPHTSPAIHGVRKRMGTVVETPALLPGMTARENLEQQYRILGMPSLAGMEELLTLVGLADTGKKKVRAFSLGMRQRLGIALALCGNPDLLLLDEPVNGLDPQGIIEIRELILQLNRERHITVVISSHILDELSRLATHYGFIHHGTMLKEITARELEAACRKCIRLTVTSTPALSRVCDSLGLDCEIINDRQADLYGDVNITNLTLALARENCEIRSFHEHDESLENYYMNLVGGDRHA